MHHFHIHIILPKTKTQLSKYPCFDRIKCIHLFLHEHASCRVDVAILCVPRPNHVYAPDSDTSGHVQYY